MYSDLKVRTMDFSIAIIGLVEKLPYSIPCKAISYQLMKSGTSVGANYRAALRSRSDREMISKLNIVLEEVDEVSFWLEIIKAKKYLLIDELETQLKEDNELISIFVTSLRKLNYKVSINKTGK